MIGIQQSFTSLYNFLAIGVLFFLKVKNNITTIKTIKNIIINRIDKNKRRLDVRMQLQSNCCHSRLKSIISVELLH